MVYNRSGRIVWPQRNLGAAERWGREVEKQVQDISTDLAREISAEGNRNRQNASAADQLASQLDSLVSQQADLTSLVTRVVQSNVAGSNDLSVTGQGTAASFGLEISEDAPEWASHGLVVAAARRVSGTITGAWTGKIEYIAKESPIVIGDVGSYKNVLDIGIGPNVNTFSSFAFPILVTLGPDRKVYLRPWGGVDGPGTVTTPYVINFSYSVTWI